MILTKREQEIIKYVAIGMSNEEIAKHLIITKHTVKAHVASILRKLNVKSRIHLVAIAMIKGYIDIDTLKNYYKS